LSRNIPIPSTNRISQAAIEFDLTEWGNAGKLLNQIQELKEIGLTQRDY
jgi:hypothetical protein